MPPDKKPKKASSYTYTGCWSCRKRHVKCDEAKPACNRCIKAGFTCAGYDFRFTGAGAGADAGRSFRRPVSQGSNTQRQPPLSSAKVNRILDDIDLATTSTQDGPFSVLSFHEGFTRVRVKEEEEGGHVQDGPLHQVALRQKGPSHTTTANQATTVPASNVLSSDLIRLSDPGAMPSAPMSRPISPLVMPRRQAELFEHWATYLCSNMSPLSASATNPFRYLYPSLALEGLSVTPDVGAARIAVFHGICGTAAWSLSKLKFQDSSYHHLSVYHDQLALQHIQQTIEQPGGLRDIAIPAAIMTCLTGDIVSGRLQLWSRHIRGGYKCLLNVLAQQPRADSTTSALCQQYLLGATLGNFGTPSEIRTLQDGILDEASYIEECHCITRPILYTIAAINALASSPKRRDPAAVESIRYQLLQIVPQVYGLLRHHLANVWYYATQIYFARAIMNSFDTQHLVNLAIEHLEKAKATGEGRSGQMLMWPLIQIGPECRTPESQVRLSNWCNSSLSIVIPHMQSFIESLRSTWSTARSLEASTGPIDIPNESSYVSYG